MGLQSQVEAKLEGVDDVLQSSAIRRIWQTINDQVRHFTCAEQTCKAAMYVTDVLVNAEGHVVALVEEQLRWVLVNEFEPGWEASKTQSPNQYYSLELVVHLMKIG